jgi:diketogulonate reductase-like aldo/keto reductase
VVQRLLEQIEAPAIVSNIHGDLLAATDIVPAVNQVELHPYFTQPAPREVHAELGIATQAWSPIGDVLVYVPGSD